MWMFGSRTTVKKVRNSLTWFSQMRGRRAGCRTPWDSREKVKIEEVFMEFPLSLEPFLAARFLGIRFKSILMHVAVAWCWTLSLFH